MVRFYLRFTGRVQGVGFRFFVAMNAERCHLTGWVKNMSDGSVTAEVQGTRQEIVSFEWMKSRKKNVHMKKMRKDFMFVIKMM